MYHHCFTPFRPRAWLVPPLLLACLASPLTLRADDSDEPPDTVYVVPDIIIEAPHVEPDYKVKSRPGFVSVLDLDVRRNRVEDLPAVLSKTIGVRVNQYGGLGSFATLSIRGSSSSQVDLFLDGIPLGDAYLGVTNVGDLPIDGIARVEVFRGYTPPHLGSTAIGGAVNLVTYDDDKWAHGGLLSHADARSSYGSFETRRQSLSLWSAAGPLRVLVHGGFIESQRNFTYEDDNGTPQNPDDDVGRTRTNNDLSSLNVLGRLEVEAGALGRLSLCHNALEREEGVPGRGTVRGINTRAERTRHLTYAQWVPPPLLGRRLRCEAATFHSYTNEKFRDLDRELSFTPQDTDNDFTGYGAQARSRFDAPVLPVSLELFAENRWEKYSPASNVAPVTKGPDGRRTSYRFAASTDVVIERLRLVLSATQRFEGYVSEFNDPPLRPWLPPTPQGEIHRDASSPQVGFRWYPASFLTVKGNYGRYFRMPTLLELYGNTGSITGNGDLEPESGLNRDIGVQLAHRGVGPLREVSLEVVYLDNKVSDLILFFPNSQFTSRPENFDTARIRGVELALSTFITRYVRLAGNYAHLDTWSTGPIPYYHGNQLPSRPASDVALFVDFMTRWWTASYEYHRIGENYLDRANLLAVPARELHNVLLQVRPGTDMVTLGVEGKNLTNNRVSDIAGYPLPGRSAYATVAFTY